MSNQLNFQNYFIHEDESHCFFYQAKYEYKRIFTQLSCNFKNFLPHQHPLLQIPSEHSIDDYLQKNDRLIFKNTFSNVKKERHFNLEYSIYFDNETKHVKERGSVQIVNNEIIITSMIFDVSNDHQIYDLLKNEHKKFKRIFESIQDGYIVLDLDGTIKESNNKTISLLGFNNHEELTQVNFFEDIISDKSQQAQFKKVIETSHEVYEIELELKKANGLPIYTLCSLHYIYGDFLTPLSIEGFIRDISLQKLQSIRKNLVANGGNLLTNISAHFLNKTFHEAIEFGLSNLGNFLEVRFLSFARLNTDSNKIEVLYEWQNYQGVYCGKSKYIQESFNKNPLICESVLQGEDYFLTDVNHHISSPAIRLLLKAECKSIAVIPAKSEEPVKGVLIASHSNPYHLFSGEELRVLRTFCEYATNSLSRSETRQELIRSQNSLKIAKDLAESSTKTKSQFLANMSHEIRTPINGIIGFTELLLTSSLTNKQKLFLEKIEESSKSLLKIINDILDLSKIEADKLELQYVEFSLYDDVLNPINDLLSHLIRSKNLYLFIIVDKHCPDYFIGDPHRLKQIFLNLIANAIKFTHSGGVSVYVSHSKVDDSPPQLRAKVVDTGIGIAKSNLLNLFQAFSQADGSITRNYGGTGLGLKITKQLLLLMNGNISVESVLNQGTCFEFYCDLLKDTEHNSSQNYSEEKIKVALIGDFKSFQTQLENQFLQLGFSTFICSEVQQLNKQSCDIIFVLDQKSPELNQRILDDIFFKENLSKLPLYLFTDNELFTKQAEKLSRCFDSVITFPLKQNHLFQIITKGNKNYSTHSIKQEDTKNNFLLPNLSQCKILIIEDNNINQLLLEELLSKTKAEIFIADDGLKGTEFVLKNDPDFFDLIFMDLHMPNLDGVSASKIIRSNKDLQKIPIIAITANIMQVDKILCLEAGMNDYISKPIQANLFYQVLNKWLSPSHFLDQKQTINQQAEALQNSLFEGINIHQALNNLCNNTSLYFKFVHNFYEDYYNCAETLLTLYTKNDFELFLGKVHTLKGLSGNLGAFHLQEILRNIEIYFKQNEPSKVFTYLDLLKNHYPLVLSDCLKFINQQKELQQNLKQSPCAMSHEEISQKLIEIIQLIKTHSFQSIIQYEKIHDFFIQSQYHQQATQLKKLLTKFQFSQAEDIIVSLLQCVKNDQIT